MKNLIVLIDLITLLYAREDIVFASGQNADFSILRKPAVDSTILFHYDNTHEDQDNIIADDTGFATFIYRIEAEPNEKIVLTYDKSIILKNDDNEIVISELDCEIDDTFTMPSDGEIDLRFRGKLTIDGGITEGSYSTNFTLDASYKNPE